MLVLIHGRMQHKISLRNVCLSDTTILLMLVTKKFIKIHPEKPVEGRPYWISRV